MLEWNELRTKPLWRIVSMCRNKQRYVLMYATDRILQGRTVYQGDILLTKDGYNVLVRYGSYLAYVPDKDRYETEYGFYLVSLTDESAPLPVEVIDNCIALAGNEHYGEMTTAGLLL